MALGVLVGCAMGLVVMMGGPPPWGLDWVLWIGTIKIGLASAVGLLASGAVVRRVALRRERRESLRPRV
jgi:hypothetical protein